MVKNNRFTRLTSLSIFFPCFNDGKSISKLVKKAMFTASKIAKDYEIIVVDDGSTDNSKKILNELQDKYPKLKIIHHKKNFGYGAALITGFKNSKKDWVFYTDGDGQYDPAEITNLLKKLTKGIDVVNGYKLKRRDNWLRKITGNLYNRLLHVLYSLPVSDVDCDFRLIKNSVLKKINLTSKSGMICLELMVKLHKAGARFAEVGINHYERRHGKSQFFKIKNILKTAYENIEFYFKR